MVDDVWDSYADGWDDMPASRAYARAAFESLLSIVDEAGIDLSGARVIDFGCGTGLLTEQLVAAGAEVVAIDTSPAMLAVLQAKSDREQWTGVSTTTALDGVSGGRDLIVCSSVCSFLDDYAAAVARLAELLRPGGMFIQWDWERGADDHGLTRSEIAEALTGAGLDHIAVATAFEVEVEGESMRPLVGHGRRSAERS